MRYRIALFVLIALLGLSACNLSSTENATAAAAATTPTGQASSKPVVTILAPQNGMQSLVNQQILVSANANDSVGVTRVQLFANTQIAKTVSSETSGGDTNLNVLLDYTPTVPGQLTLSVVAYRGSIASDPAQVVLTIISQGQTQAPPVVVTQPPVIPIPPPNPYDPTCRLLTNASLNLRTGPGTVYPVIAVLATGTVAPITGRTADNSWWQVRVGNTTGWVSGSYVTLYGQCQNVAIPPIPPTPTPYFTLTYVPTSTLTLTAQPPTNTPVPGFPDLVVTNLGLAAGGTSLDLSGGASVTGTFSVVVTNTGSSPAGQFNNVININPPGTDTLLGVVGGLNPGESIVLNIDLTFTTAGTYQLQVRSDSDSQITEVSEVNNSANMTLTINP